MSTGQDAMMMGDVLWQVQKPDQAMDGGRRGGGWRTEANLPGGNG